MPTHRHGLRIFTETPGEVWDRDVRRGAALVAVVGCLTGLVAAYYLASGGPDAQGAGVCRVTLRWVGGVVTIGVGGGPSVAQSAQGATPVTAL